MNFQEAVSYLTNLSKFGINLGLSRMEYLLQQFGNPEKKLKVIHVAGTNGKGSTVTMTANILKEAGFRVGVYISPHLYCFTERMTINGEPIPQEKLAELTARVKPTLEALPHETDLDEATEFEVTTLLAFLYFLEEKVDFVILEVGLGGRLDATNVVNPLVSVVTNVDLDHMDQLGNTLKAIAGEKAGIIKENSLVVTASYEPEVLEVIKGVCAEKKARLWQVGKDILWEKGPCSLFKQCFNLEVAGKRYEDMETGLLGEHQILNAATAFGVTEALKVRGIAIDEKAIRQGLAKSKWPGRLEIMQENPLVIVDGAHNEAGAKILRKALQEVFEYENLILVLAIFADKAVGDVVKELVPLANKVIVARSHNPRALDPEALAEEARKYTGQVIVKDEILTGVQEALTLAGPQDMVCIAGSLSTMSEARKYWEKQRG